MKRTSGPARTTRRRLILGGAAITIAAAGACGIVANREQTVGRYEGPNPPRGLPVGATISPAPELALVLGGGGPRGFGHVGAIVALERIGVVPDLIVGSSIGALVGALLAAGRRASEIRALALDVSMFDLADFNFGAGATLKGDALERFVSELLGGRAIEALGVRFVAVATHLPTGERVEFGSGDAAAAIRASSAIPGLFPPYEIDGEFYADGDLNAPLPVLTAKRLGAKRIVALDVSADLETTPSLREIPMEWIERDIYRRKLIDVEAAHASVYVRIRLPYYAGMRGEYRELAIARGEEAIERSRDALLALRAR